MAKSTFKRCPCGKAVETRRPSELVVSDYASGEVRSVIHTFLGYCDQHGWFDEESVSHHVSMWERRFKRDFPKASRDALLKNLSDRDCRRFKDMLYGRLRVDWNWLERLKSMRACVVRHD